MATRSLSGLIGNVNSRGKVVRDDTGRYSYQSGSGNISKNTAMLSNEVTLYAFYQETKAICPNPREGDQEEEAIAIGCCIISADRLTTTNALIPYGRWTYIFVEPYAEIVFSFSGSNLYTKDECKDTGGWIEGRRYPNVNVCNVDVRQWALTSDGITTSELSTLTPSSPLNPPLPKCIWRLENGEITHKRFSEAALPLHEPLPYCLWRSTPSERDYIFHRRLPDHLPPTTLGAFTNAESLRRVIIPESVKTIGSNSFQNTALKRVRIAVDCTYNTETTFPVGCKVNFYPDSNCAQLYDSSGKAVLDCNAARIFVKRSEENG